MTVRSEDLVLEVSQQSAFQLGPYQRFLDQLTLIGGPHQNEALQVACRYLLGGRYASLLDLAQENWDRNEKIREHYGYQRERFLDAQQVGALLAGSIDHATATGKSYLIFGAAVVALASGEVDRVLVLCPSNTIENGLTRKFRELASKRELMDLLPESATTRAPDVVNAYEGTVPAGAICVENIHAAYSRSLSSIRDSFEGQGDRTLVVNDEAHHVYTIEAGRGASRIREWLAFLLDPAFGFRRVLNLSGTCFIGNAYFPDVIHRYGLQQARLERRIKDIRYWESQHDFPTSRARWAAVLENHREQGRTYTGIKPITIFVTDTVARAKVIHQEFRDFLAESPEIGPGAAAELTLVVSSHDEHQANLPILARVDASDNRVEFIFSVSMLTEGWDVKNVLQIVPHEKRAFDSKLLISQVLGRGLRLLAEPYRDARVIVFNHARWAPEIRRLFDDVWENEQRVYATPMPGSEFHFELEQLEVERGSVPVTSTNGPRGRAAGEPLRLLPQRRREVAGALVDLSGRHEERRYHYAEPVRPLDEIVQEISVARQAAALETGAWDETDGDFEATLRREIVAALRDAQTEDELVSDSNRARILAWLRPAPPARRMAFRTTRERLAPRSTRTLGSVSAGRSELSRDVTLVVAADNGRAVRWPGHDTRQYDLLDRILADEDLPRRAVIAVTDLAQWRTPTDAVIVSHEPERRFVRELLLRGEASGVAAWVKSPDSGFYAVPYTVTVGGVARNAAFHPDWFLKKDQDVLVVETKMDGDTSEENRAKLRGATEYFAAVNRLREGQPGRYYAKFLSPTDYTAFFDSLAGASYPRFLSTLEAELR